MNLTSIIGKSLLWVALALFVPSVSALDIILLKNGNSLIGQIYQKDEDGSVYLNLSNGTKRYIQNDEIAIIKSVTEKSKTKEPQSSISEKKLMHEYSDFNINELIEKLDSANIRINDLEEKITEDTKALQAVTKELTKHKSSEPDNWTNIQLLIIDLQEQLKQNKTELENTKTLVAFLNKRIKYLQISGQWRWVGTKKPQSSRIH